MKAFVQVGKNHYTKTYRTARIFCENNTLSIEKFPNGLYQLNREKDVSGTIEMCVNHSWESILCHFLSKKRYILFNSLSGGYLYINKKYKELQKYNNKIAQRIEDTDSL